MKFFAALLFWFSLLPALGQQPRFAVRRLRLPPELAYYDNQFSGLSISGNQLIIMSESRLQDKAEAKLYTVKLADLDHQLRDSTFALPYQKLPLQHLEKLRARMHQAGQSYEGLEAMLADGATIYFSVETATPSTNCYLLKGTLGPKAVVLDTTVLVPLPKPLAPGGAHIYNAGFEALAAVHKRLYAFFEYNYFPTANSVYELNERRLSNYSPLGQQPIAKVPFRVTDLTPAGGDRFVGINYFFKGDGGDAVYRTPASETANAALIVDKADKSGYKNYCRLITIELKNNQFSWQPLWEFPEQYRSYNWEGIAAYQGGYFIINDKYSPSKPYQTTLLYLQPLGK
ncbi:hypothetical protein HHL22_01475 [Hymenobacter sp. RP-2-7]|uniref:Uncharacterized protein n=1 Tax=Hymenobacter polaris TaxID=2682546 RepID=A0A7Y0AAN6_9BACT|nr:hypothetical protein [Hymenobacter polaris]NML63865.1 hypothetical protein [Hymenobacter polaris]